MQIVDTLVQQLLGIEPLTIVAIMVVVLYANIGLERMSADLSALLLVRWLISLVFSTEPVVRTINHYGLVVVLVASFPIATGALILNRLPAEIRAELISQVWAWVDRAVLWGCGCVADWYAARHPGEACPLVTSSSPCGCNGRTQTPHLPRLAE